MSNYIPPVRKCELETGVKYVFDDGVTVMNCIYHPDKKYAYHGVMVHGSRGCYYE